MQHICHFLTPQWTPAAASKEFLIPLPLSSVTCSPRFTAHRVEVGWAVEEELGCVYCLLYFISSGFQLLNEIPPGCGRVLSERRSNCNYCRSSYELRTNLNCQYRPSRTMNDTSRPHRTIIRRRRTLWVVKGGFLGRSALSDWRSGAVISEQRSAISDWRLVISVKPFQGYDFVCLFFPRLHRGLWGLNPFRVWYSY